MKKDAELERIEVIRKTTESQITVAFAPDAIQPDYRKRINTKLLFLNHMIEHIIWRSGYAIEIETELDEFTLNHLICEDVGLTVGKAIAQYFDRHKSDGIVGYGNAVSIIDEAKAEACFSFEHRAYFGFSSAVDIPVMAEDVASEDLLVFLDGLAQGANCTLHLDVHKGANSHHIWEAAFRAVGLALAQALALDGKRRNMYAGVAGAVEFMIK